jgi:VCBS repeat-containing protein
MKPTARTSTKVATQTGAAKDDVLGGVSEEEGGVLDVLANDPGSAALYSVAQNPGVASTTNQFPIELSAETSMGGTIAIVDGVLVYTPPSEAFQHLPGGVIGYDTFIYTIRMANGALSSANVTVEVMGVNDEAVITGDDTGSVTEDGTLTTGGTLYVSDDDDGESAFETDGEIAGLYGTFNFEAATGAWTYTLNNDHDDVQALNDGESLEDTLTVSSVDGTTATITVTINGVDEPPPEEEEPPPENPVDEHMVNHGLSEVNGRKVIYGFDSNDLLKHAGNYDYKSFELFDFDGDGSDDSTLVMLEYSAGGGKADLPVVLVGYMDFSTSQLA